MVKDHWIQEALGEKSKGKLRKKLGVPKGKRIPTAALNKASKAKGALGKEARLAKTLKSFKK